MIGMKWNVHMMGMMWNAHDGDNLSISVGTLTFTRMIEMRVESDFATERVQSTITGHFFYFGEYG
jgi:hypothetical protein